MSMTCDAPGCTQVAVVRIRDYCYCHDHAGQFWPRPPLVRYNLLHERS